MKKKYILVSFPESQVIINHPRFNECRLVDSGDDNDESGTYAVPEDLYEDVYGKKEFAIGDIFSFGLKRIKVVISDSCDNCIFHHRSVCVNLHNYIGPCLNENRTDNTSVSFVEYKE